MTSRIFQITISLGLSALMIFVVFSEVSYSRLLEIFGALNLPLLVAYVGCSVVGWQLRSWRTWYLVNRLLEQRATSVSKNKAISFGQVSLVVGIRNAAVDLLPARLGEIVSVYFLNRLGVGLVAGFATLGLGFVIDLIGLLLLCSAILLLNSLSGVVIVLTVLIALLLLLSVVYLPELAFGLLNFAQRHQSLAPLRALQLILVDLVAELGALKDRRFLLHLLGVTLLLRIAKYAGLMLLLLSVIAQWDVSFQQLDPLLVLGAFVGAEAGASLPISGVMGFGAYEGIWSVVFQRACVAPQCLNIPAVSVAFSVHLITQLVGYSLGFICAACLCLNSCRSCDTLRRT